MSALGLRVIALGDRFTAMEARFTTIHTPSASHRRHD
jgi:hypothetical protein